MEKQSLLKEYMQLTRKAWSNKDKVIEGHWNRKLNDFGLLDPVKQSEAERRFRICSDCPFNSEKAKTSNEFTKLYAEGEISNAKTPEEKERLEMEFSINPPHLVTQRGDLFCSWCGCPVESKTMSMDSDCGLFDYNLQYPNNKQELKWKALDS